MASQEKGFRIGTGEDTELRVHSGRDIQQNRREAQRLTRLSSRLTWTTALLLLLMTGMGVAAYFFIEPPRDIATQADVTRLETAAKELSDRIGKLDESVTALQATAGKPSPLEDTLKQFGESLEEIREQVKSSLAAMRSEIKGKADTAAVEESLKRLSTAMTAISGSVESVGQDLGELGTQTTAATERLSQEMTGLSTRIRENKEAHDKLKAEILDVMGTTLDRKSLEKALKAQETRFEQEAETLRQQLRERDQRITLLSDRLKNMETRIQFLEKAPMGRPTPGKVLEQNIQ